MLKKFKTFFFVFEVLKSHSRSTGIPTFFISLFSIFKVALCICMINEWLGWVRQVIAHLRRSTLVFCDNENSHFYSISLSFLIRYRVEIVKEYLLHIQNTSCVIQVKVRNPQQFFWPEMKKIWKSYISYGLVIYKFLEHYKGSKLNVRKIFYYIKKDHIKCGFCLQ